MKWLLVIIFNTIETPIQTFATAKECESTGMNMAQFFAESQASLHERANARFECRAIGGK